MSWSASTHGVDADRAQEIIENLVSKEVPAVEEIDGQPVILKDDDVVSLGPVEKDRSELPA